MVHFSAHSLRRDRQRREAMLGVVYEEIAERATRHIQAADRIRRTACSFTIPRFSIGRPLLDAPEVMRYLRAYFMRKGFRVYGTDRPNVLVFDWSAPPVPFPPPSHSSHPSHPSHPLSRNPSRRRRALPSPSSIPTFSSSENRGHSRRSDPKQQKQKDEFTYIRDQGTAAAFPPKTTQSAFAASSSSSTSPTSGGGGWSAQKESLSERLSRVKKKLLKK